MQTRLWRVAGITFAAVLIFLARDYFMQVEVHDELLWTMHVLTVLALGVCFIWLNPHEPLSMCELMVCEVVVFGGPMLFLLVMQRQLLFLAAETGVAHDPVGPWLILMLTYALFIPTTLRRAIVILGTMAMAPVVLIGGGIYLHESVAHAWGMEELSRITLCMLFGAATLIYGSMTIGTLRREVDAARKLGQYWLRDLIGAGGMGEVYLAEHQLLKRQCAIKLIPPARASDPKALARFEREVRTTATLSHPNTVEIYDYGRTDEGTFYYVMEYLKGMNLSQLVRAAGPLPPSRVIHLMQQVCGALHEAHSIGFVHRDVKPANIFASIRGGVYDLVKLLDFGLVKSIVPNESHHNTREGAITGSPLFMSPEQAAGEITPDARSDIYSLGAVGYFLLTGRPPFEGTNPVQVLVGHLHDTPLPVSRWRAEVPMDLEAVVMQCLEKSPENRFKTVRDLSHALSRCEAAGRWTPEDAEKWWERMGQCATTPTISDANTTAIT